MVHGANSNRYNLQSMHEALWSTSFYFNENFSETGKTAI